ncbi:hypothetical protein [Streptomyces sp. CoH17]|uniref:hypothetical protein n=1 Tax=Streptomyces sp. CoH17 TaxID=2992806 RepID=UPI00226E780E|nr:hypothetical protein [Streptomyces sp. CoH17]
MQNTQFADHVEKLLGQFRKGLLTAGTFEQELYFLLGDAEKGKVSNWVEGTKES